MDICTQPARNIPSSSATSRRSPSCHGTSSPKTTSTSTARRRFSTARSNGVSELRERPTEQPNWVEEDRHQRGGRLPRKNYKDMALNRKEILEVDALLHERVYEKDEIIFEEGDDGHGIFIIISGKVRAVPSHELL